MNEEPTTEGHGAGAEPNRVQAWQAWSGGWMMGIGFGVLVVTIATELPNDFYERSRVALRAAGVVSLVWGILRTRSSKKLRRMVFSPKG